MAYIWAVYRGDTFLTHGTAVEVIERLKIPSGTFASACSKKVHALAKANPDNELLYAFKIGETKSEEERENTVIRRTHNRVAPKLTEIEVKPPKKIIKKKHEFKPWNFTGCKNEKWLKFIDERVSW